MKKQLKLRKILECKDLAQEEKATHPKQDLFQHKFAVFVLTFLLSQIILYFIIYILALNIYSGLLQLFLLKMKTQVRIHALR